MPCYNKVEYIGEMFDSILAQEWDNIELILVNDGSTDGTRDVIELYEPRFRARGFEVVIVDQENAGVCAAAKAGLMRITGEYVCMVDSDDELDPKYVSTMAGGLEESPDFDYSMCDSVHYTGAGKEKVFRPSGYSMAESGCPNMAEQILLNRVCPAPWSYMVRTEYLRKCRIIEHYDTMTKGSHEPSFMTPLAAYGGRIRVFPDELYHFNMSMEISHSRPDGFNKLYGHYQTRYELNRRAILLLSNGVADDERKRRLLAIAELRRLKEDSFLASRPEGADIKAQLAQRAADFLNRSGLLSVPLDSGKVAGKEIYALRMAGMAYLGETPPDICINGRVVGYGALGRTAKRLLPLLQGTKLEPSELWDINGGNGVVTRPDFNALTPEDVLLVFPVGEIEAKLREEFADLPSCTIYSKEIDSYFPELCFGRYFKSNAD